MYLAKFYDILRDIRLNFILFKERMVTIMKYLLTDEMLTGHKAIDNQHAELFQAINDLFDACATGEGRKNVAKTSQFLINYVNKHFADEESLQIKTNYPEFSAHKTFHDTYKKSLYEDLKSLDEENVSIASLSLINTSIAKLISHIKIEDKKIAKHIKSKIG